MSGLLNDSPESSASGWLGDDIVPRISSMTYVGCLQYASVIGAELRAASAMRIPSMTYAASCMSTMVLVLFEYI
ncbi:hypothetical protein E4U13_008242 [Claviceps humidiphila]|uniref:Uncharacterized protein n=1 Tax=Claviceps humidiphila TaxID=1294629 RepID=A0A9P7TUV8_9HYPO|nr:hypothetical protein E4U13_008242 [Claviceps humidiphila]